MIATALAATAGVTAAIVTVPSFAAVQPSPLSELAKQWFAIKAKLAALDSEPDAATADAVLNDGCDRQNEIEQVMNATLAMTPADANGHLEDARADMIQFKFDGIPDKIGEGGGDLGDVLALSAIDNALRVLRSIGGAA
jgi:hypothetical protein